MSDNRILPLQKIGELHWVDNLKKFLEKYEILSEGISLREETTLIPFGFGDEIRLYYKYFGATDSAEFMYYLLKAKELRWLHESAYAAQLAKNFTKEDLAAYVLIAESRNADPICLHIDSQAIYTFSKKTAEKHLLFHSFTDFLLLELIQFKKQVCEFDFDSLEEEHRYTNTLVNNEGISNHFRHEKLYKM